MSGLCAICGSGRYCWLHDTRDGESIGQLHDHLPVGEPVALPEYGVVIERWPSPPESTKEGETP